MKCSYKDLHVFFGFFIADRTQVSFVLLMTLLAGSQVSALIDITNAIRFAELAVQTTFIHCSKHHFFFKVVKLPLTDSFSSCLISRPNIFDGTVNQKITDSQHRKSNYQFFESDFVDFFIPEGSDSINGFYFRLQGF